MARTGVFSVNNNASSAELMVSHVNTTTKQAPTLRNNLIGHPTFHLTSRQCFSDETISNQNGKRKASDVIDFFSIDNRKIPKLGPCGLKQSSASLLKEEDITLQLGIGNKGEVLQQECDRVSHELDVTKAELYARNAELEAMKAELQRIGEENSSMCEEMDRLKTLVAYCNYQMNLRHSGHQASYPVPSHTLRKMFSAKQHMMQLPTSTSAPFTTNNMRDTQTISPAAQQRAAQKLTRPSSLRYVLTESQNLPPQIIRPKLSVVQCRAIQDENSCDTTRITTHR